MLPAAASLHTSMHSSYFLVACCVAAARHRQPYPSFPTNTSVLAKGEQKIIK
jgi:hypothetical protein